MELIYTDTNRIEQGIIDDVSCDFAFGSDENDFEIVTTKRNAIIELGGYIYYDDTEYGGRVDEMETASSGDELKYRGRTWHGILNSYVVEGISTDRLQPRDEFISCAGKVSDIINDLVSFFGLTDIFEVDEFDGEVDTQVTRRLGAYDFLLELFRKNDMKMTFSHTDGKCHIIPSYAVDYTDSQYFDDDKMNLSVVNGRKFTNHFVLHTYDEEEGAHYICHLFTDELGIIQDYFIPDTVEAVIDGQTIIRENIAPLRDGEYIPDMRNRVITGQDEVVQLLEGTSSTTNYVPVILGVNTEEENGIPKGWHTLDYCYDKYYYQEADEDTGEMKWVQHKREYEFEALQLQPDDWNLHWSDYYKKVDDAYSKLTEDDCLHMTTHYDKQATYDYFHRIGSLDRELWAQEYNLCFTTKWDGVQYIKEYLQSESAYRYQLQTQRQPDDWNENKSNYYVKAKIYEYTIVQYSKKKGAGKKIKTYKTQNLKSFNKKYNASLKAKKGSYSNMKGAHSGSHPAGSFKVTKIVCLANGYITTSNYCSIKGKDLAKLKWKPRFFYTQYSNGDKPPAWKNGEYMMDKTRVAGPPTFVAGRFYAEADLVKPPYANNKYYYQAKDHFANLVEKAQEELANQLQDLEKLDGTLEEEYGEFDIGDIVGGKENITGIVGKSYVKKKIAKIDAFKTEINYEIG